MRFRLYYLLFVLAVVIVYGCDSSPTEPVLPDGYSVRGTVMMISDGYVTIGEQVDMHLTGSGLDLAAKVGGDGEFVFENVPSGEYLLTPVRNGHVFEPPARSLIVSGDTADAGLYYGGALESGEYTIVGRAVDSRNLPLEGITVTIRNMAFPDFLTTGEDGYFVISGDGDVPLVAGETYILSAYRSGYDFRGGSTKGYRLSPDSSFVTIDSNITLSDFRYDEPLYSVSGRFVDINGVNISGIEILLRNTDDSRTAYMQALGSDGHFEFKGLPNGAYRFYFPSSLIMPTTYYFDVSTNTLITVDGVDVETDDIHTYYQGPTYYRLKGAILDGEGNGVPGVNVMVDGSRYLLSSDITEADGSFNCKIQLPIGYTESLDVSFHKAGLFFTPPEVNAGEVSWREGQRDGDILTAPAIVGIDREPYDVNAYFPLSPGNSWTYRTTDANGSSGERIIDITGLHQLDSVAWMTTSELGPGNYRDYRVEGNDLHVLDRHGDDLILLRFGLLPGTEWVVRREAGTYDHVGEYLGTETITAPNGEHADCEVFSIHIQYGQSSDEHTTMWFAHGVGLVKMEQTIISNSAVVSSRTDELVSYQLR